jgi:hypothetical protein
MAHSTRYRSLLVAIATVLALGVGTASAGTTARIEGVWSFNGGQIGVQHLSNGTYAGTVVAETKFAECVHPVGQQIWTDMTKQSDGSYWGLHQWYSANCQENPQRGPTAWRILEAANGSHYLRVCFSHPSTSQPTIAADGAPKEASEYAAYHVTYGCDNSALIAPLPVAPSGKGGGSEGLTLPSAKQCLKIRRFKIRLRNPKYDPFKKVTITLNGHKIATSRKGNYVVATISLKGLRKGSFTIKVRATTVLGHHLSASRTYHTCREKKRSKKG